jgi:putative transposase
MSYIRIYVHLVFCTKNRYPFLKAEFSSDLFSHIKSNAIKKELWLDSVNGHLDHVHCLIALRRNHSILM